MAVKRDISERLSLAAWIIEICMMMTTVAAVSNISPATNHSISSTMSLHSSMVQQVSSYYAGNYTIIENRASSTSTFHLSATTRSETKASTRITTTTTKPPISIYYKFKSLKFFVSGKFTDRRKNMSKNLNDSENTPAEILKTKFDQLFASDDLESYNLTSYNLKTDKFEVFFIFNASKDMDVTLVKSKFLDHDNFTDIFVKERCGTATCGNVKNRCQEDKTSIVCSCHIGFVGRRCSILQAVDGTVYGSWSNWTSCHTCTQKRFRYCLPDPMHGGRCIIGPTAKIEVRTCYEDCKRNDGDDDYEIVGFVCIGLLILILILLIAFCCTNKFMVNANKKSSSRASDSNPALDAYRVPSVLINSAHISHRKSSSRRSKRSEGKTSRAKSPVYAIPMKRMNETNDHALSPGMDNLGYRNHDDSEDLYRQQLEIFLNDAPGMSQNGVTTETPPSRRASVGTAGSGRTSSADGNIFLKADKKDSDGNLSEQNVAGSFTPAVNKQKEIQNKIIDRGPSRFQLVMT